MPLIQDTVQPGVLSQPIQISFHRLIGSHNYIMLTQQGLQQLALFWAALILQGLQQAPLHKLANLMSPVRDQGWRAYNEGGRREQACCLLVCNGSCTHNGQGTVST